MSNDPPTQDESNPIDPTGSSRARSVVRSVLLIIYPAFGGVLAALAIENASTLLIEVRLTLFSWQTLIVPVWLLLLVSAALGALLLYGVAVYSAWEDRCELAHLRKRVAELEQARRRDSAGETAGALQRPPALWVPVPIPGMPLSRTPLEVKQHR